jgi:alkanesulfonate monooxygenase SsuD/methylene tetrahydromethanopterin reductase-like flavin-dependent oxidoreductase (luciferase family)
MTSVLVPAGRQHVLLAKQAATLSAVSNGRFRLGVGIGGRPDDWLAIGAEPRRRGRVLDDLIATCRTVWAGQPVDSVGGPIGPAPINLSLVLGGYSEPAFRRAGRLADALLVGPMPPDFVGQAYAVAKQAASEAGRPAPTLYAARYTALGDDVEADAERNMASYYGFGGPPAVERVTSNLLRTPHAVKDTLAALEQLGVAEVCLWSATTAPDQVDRIADAALG